MTHKYTFLLPAYKRKFLKEALDSIYYQSFEDFSVIISDDCSPENLYEIARPYLEDKRFIYRRNKTNIGGRSLVAHWNMLLDLCDSEYVIMASDDDMYHRDFLQCIDTLTCKYPDINLFRARVKRIVGNELMEMDPTCEESVSQLRFLFDTYMYNHIHCIGNYVFNKKQLDALRGFYDYPVAWFSDDRATIEMAANGVASTKDIMFTMRNSELNISSEDNCSTASALAKVTACKQFLLWFNDYSKAIPNDNSLYENRLHTKMTCQVRNYVYNLIKTYIPRLSLKDYIDIKRFLYFQWLEPQKVNKILLTLQWLKLHNKL